MQRSLTDTNEEGIRSFHHSLVDAKQTIGGDLQRNVYRNYTEFVLISKEVSNLDTDVLQLKGYLNELRSIWENLLEDSSVQDDVSLIGKKRKRTRLSFVFFFPIDLPAARALSKANSIIGACLSATNATI